LPKGLLHSFSPLLLTTQYFHSTDEDLTLAGVQEMYSKSSLLVARDGGIRPPPEVLASWPAPNWINPEERGWEAPIVLLIVLAITFLVYTARIWARLAVAKSMGLDDVLMSLAMLFVFGLTISVVLGMSKSSEQSFGSSLNIYSYSGLRLPMARLGSD
jgi:hypothetical protein